MDTLEITLFNDKNDFVVKNKDGSFTFIQKSSKAAITKSAEYVENIRGIIILGIVGVLKGRNANYLLVINKATLCGHIHTSKVFKINEIKFVNFIGEGALTNDEDKEYEKMIQDFLERNSLYFSDSYDLTTSIAKQFTKHQFSPKTLKPILPSNITAKTPFSNINPIYCWNFELGKTLDNALLQNILVPVINGSVGVSQVNYNTSNKAKQFTFSLISRKDTRRSGMRFLVRGADLNGFCANYVETEQVILSEDNEGGINLISYLQCRGSIPLSWKQEPDLQLNPDVRNLIINYYRLKFLQITI